MPRKQKPDDKDVKSEDAGKKKAPPVSTPKTASASKAARATGKRKPATAKKKKKSVSAKSESEATSRAANSDLLIVGIGASAGGLEAFERFFEKMPPNSGMAFVLVPHLSPEHKSIMSELLARYTEMKINQAREGDEVEPDHVYIIPPDRDLSIMNGRLRLLEPTERRGLRHSIDFFFRSLAEDRGENAVSIVLSGTGTEGAMGIRAVKESGGLVIAQDPKDAKYDGMPSSAVATGLADFVLPVDEMPEKLLAYAKSFRAGTRLPHAAAKGTLAELVQKVLMLVRLRTGHDFSQYKQNTVLRRINKRMAVRQIEDIRDYVIYLRNFPEEAETLFRELLIRVTSFFRDPEAYETLERDALPALFKDWPPDRPVRAWVTGCSTGEEAYSLAIVLLEHLRKKGVNREVQMFATDVDARAIDIARAGIYPGSIEGDVSQEQLMQYFVKTGLSYKIKDEVRDKVVFATQNMVKDPPFSKIDIISCRNVLIYMGAELQKKVLPLFHYALNPGGLLFLGSSETIGDNNDLFTVEDKKWRIFKARKPGPSVPADVGFDIRKPVYNRTSTVPQAVNTAQDEPNIGELTARILLEKFTPASLIVNEHGNILYFHGKTGKYIEPPAGEASLNVFDMAKEGLRLELRAALRRASKDKKDVSVRGIEVKTNGAASLVDIDVVFIDKNVRQHDLFMVVFRDAFPSEPKSARVRAVPAKKVQGRIEELESELKFTKEHLQSTIEELETSNEEMQSINEELQSSNEELQSTNEELETSQEELQSVNEELLTVNAELQNKIDELSLAYNDMNNLLASTRIGTIFLDQELCIKRFTPEITSVINLIPTDVGRPISDIVTKLYYPGLVEDAREVLIGKSLLEKTVRHRDGRWYMARLLPYMTVEDVADGVVITFVDITGQKEDRAAALAARSYTDDIIETIREPLLALDDELRVITANRSFYVLFRTTPEKTVGRVVYELCGGLWDIPSLRELLEKTLKLGEKLEEGVPVEQDFGEAGRMKILLNARRIGGADVNTGTTLLAIEHIN